MSVQVTSVSGKAEQLQDAAAAVFVLTHEDLRHSGATNIPDALRNVPGLHVARIDATRWAVSARGFNGRFANKLLVLMDGRQLYSPIYSGVFWDEQRVPFDLIERIEVIRGPGATIWGANAVNGVINIITRSANAEAGSEIELSGGNRGSYAGFARNSGMLRADVAYRAYASSMSADPTDTSTGRDSDDVWRDMQAGIRFDWNPGEHDRLSLQAQVHHGNSEERLRLATFDPLSISTIHGMIDTRGGFLSGAWEHETTSGGRLSVHAHMNDSERRSELFESDQRFYEFGLQHQFKPWSAHELVWGLSYRYSDIPVEPGTNSSLIGPTDESVESIEAFLQDEIALTPELALIIGSKIEHTESAGWEPQPNIRLAWTGDNYTLWGAISRAVRTPSQGESEFRQIGVPVIIPPRTPNNPTPLPVGIRLQGNPDLGSERLLAYELGMRAQLGDALGISISLYQHEYEALISARQLGTTCEPSGTPVASNPACLFSSAYLLARTDVHNSGEASEHGVEMDLTWHINDALRVAGQLTVRDLDQKTGGRDIGFGAGYGPGDPQRLASVQFGWRASESVEVNLGLRHVGEAKKYDIDAYTTADVRLAWRMTTGVNLELIGSNLLDSSHLEYSSELNDLEPGIVKRTASARITWVR